MFEAQVAQGIMWKKIVEAVKELVTEANFQITPAGLGIQAMDSAHVALVALSLMKSGFAIFNAERNAMIGVNLTNLSKILKTTENNDVITLRQVEDADVLSVIAEAHDRTKTSEYQLKLMEIEADTMSIPEIEYATRISLGSADFAKICRDMSIFGDTVTVQVTRDGIKFSAVSEMGEGFAFLRAGGTVDSVKRESGVKSEVKREKNEDESYPKRAGTNASQATESVSIELAEPITLSFALRYFTIFSKASTLSSRVTLSLAAESPCMIEFEIEGLGFLRFYLAPKVEEE